MQIPLPIAERELHKNHVQHKLNPKGNRRICVVVYWAEYWSLRKQNQHILIQKWYHMFPPEWLSAHIYIHPWLTYGDTTLQVVYLTHCLSDAQILPWSHVKLTYCTLERVRTFLLTSSLLSGLKHLRAVVHILLLFYTIFRTERKAKSSKEGKYKNLPGGRM